MPSARISRVQFNGIVHRTTSRSACWRPKAFCAMNLVQPWMNAAIPRQTAGVPPALTGSLTPPQLNAAPRRAADPAQECCDRCGSIRLIRVKSCWRCDACGYKSDCNGGKRSSGLESGGIMWSRRDFLSTVAAGVALGRGVARLAGGARRDPDRAQRPGGSADVEPSGVSPKDLASTLAKVRAMGFRDVEGPDSGSTPSESSGGARRRRAPVPVGAHGVRTGP